MPRNILIRPTLIAGFPKPAYTLAPTPPNPDEGITIYVVDNEETYFVDEQNNVINTPDWPEGGDAGPGGGPDNDY